MAEYLYKIEGIYETDKGSGVDLTNFSFEIKLSRFYPEGAGSHILRRFLPILIRNKKNMPSLSKVKNFLIVDVKKISDEFPLVDKEISEMSEYEIQELACMYDIFEIPLPYTQSITELRKNAMEAYMKKVLHVPLDTPDDLKKLGFYKENPDGTIELDLGEQKLVVELVNDFIKTKKPQKKLTLDDFRKNVVSNNVDGILDIKTEIGDENESENENKFPDLNNLIN